MAEFKKQYNPNRGNDWNYGGKNWKLSRSKIELFTECPRCFYLDNKLGTARPRGPAFTLNVAVDTLFKREFDTYRKKQEPHPLMLEYGVKALPFAHKDIDTWRDNFAGITYLDEGTGMTISGAIDDIWQNEAKELLIVDYKATAKESKIVDLSDSGWEESYRRQMGVYQWLFEKNGFKVSNIGYFVYANARIGETDSFDNTLGFEVTVIPMEGDNNWIPETITKIKACLESSEIPKSGAQCEYCPYRETSGKKLQAIHFAKK